MRTLHKIWVIALLVITISFSSVQIVCAAGTENTWTKKASIPNFGYNFRSTVVNDKIYLMGETTNYEYTPATDSWTNKTPMPTPRYSFVIASYQSKIYVLGGCIDDDNHVLENEVYDTLTDTWQTLKPIPVSISSISANVIGGKIFLFGKNISQSYDIASDMWTTKSPMPYPAIVYASAVVNDKLYIMGGYSSSHPLKETQIYDPKTDTWSLGAPSSSPTYSTACAATIGTMAPKRIYVIGGCLYGENPYSDALNTVSVYDPVTNNWTLGASMPTARLGATAAIVNDEIYVFGGSASGIFGGYYYVNEQYTPFGYGTPDPTYGAVPEFGPEALILLLASVTATSILALNARRKRLI